MEAHEQFKQAEKALAKRSFFRPAPDYLVAAPLFEKAGECFRLGGDFEASKDAFRQCANAHQHNQSYFRAAQAWENIAKTALQQSQAQRSENKPIQTVQERTIEARQAYEKASSLYVEMGELGKAADALLKGAQTCESHGCSSLNLDDLLPLYWQACDLLEAQDKPHFAVDTFRKTLSFLVKHGKYMEGIKLLDRMVILYQAMDQSHNVHKAHLSQVILHLAVGDVPAADALYSRCLQDDSFLSSDDCALAEDLVRAFKMGNEDLLQATVRKPGFMALDNETGRLCRKLSVYGSENAASAQPKRTQKPVSSRAGNMHQQQQSTQHNPVASPARASRAQRNPFAPSSKVPAQASSLHSEYESSETPTALTTDAHDSDYEAALAKALGEVDVSKKKKKLSAPASASKTKQHASPTPTATSSRLSPNLASSPPPAAQRASNRVDYECDGLEFAMSDSDLLEFSMSDSAHTGTNDYCDSFESATAPAPKAKAPVSKRVTKAAAPVYDEFDLT
ncbi:unnamed protein product [Peronospora belbahrii]|uniref:Gamma-soluble NSF attachment protein n=1 Tax=Peronospora belbahrii TaxID=622444 RepID=A0AAU9KUW1_9STRA|nr:unnamed protein product [Peronospora belbahrii]CAH0517690.1 unnamed protein product [Peronospora belbahrii]